jgi:hypothetical protein
VFSTAEHVSIVWRKLHYGVYIGTAVPYTDQNAVTAPAFGKARFMKIRMKSLLAVCALALSLAADTASVTGKWKILSSIGGTENETVCTFSQKDSAVTGNCTSDKGTMEITGKVDADKVTWSYKSEYQGTALTVRYAGAMASASVIKGSVEVPEFGAFGDFTANRSE